MERVDWADAIFNSCQGDISVWVLTTKNYELRTKNEELMLHSPAEVDARPNHASNADLFEE